MRDPRVDPQPGDVLKTNTNPPRNIEVVSRTDKWVSFLRGGRRITMRLTKWRKLYADAAVHTVEPQEGGPAGPADMAIYDRMAQRHHDAVVAPESAEYTDDEVRLFLSIAFRHVDIKGDFTCDDVRLGMRFVTNARARRGCANDALTPGGRSDGLNYNEGTVLVPVNELRAILDGNLAAAEEAIQYAGGSIDFIEQRGGAESEDTADRIAYHLFYTLFAAERLRALLPAVPEGGAE